MRNIRRIAALVGILVLGLSAGNSRANEGEACLPELEGSAFAKVLRFDGGVIHVDQKSSRFVKARAIGPQRYLVEYRANDKPGAPVFTGVLTLTSKGKLVGFVVENPKGQTVRDCGPKEDAKRSPTPTPTPSITATPKPNVTEAPKPAATVAPPSEEPPPARIEVETENGD